MRRRHPPLLSLVVSALLVGSFAPGPAGLGAQIPDEFTNLQVLPEDIERDELIGTMREFSFALGVRCSYCHTVSDALGEPDDDFVSDAKETKERARAMMRMARAINTEYLAALPGRRSPPVEVMCRTCHSGVPRPETLDVRMARTIDEEGAEAAVEEWRALKERHYGRGTYDFGSRVLLRVAEGLMGRERPREALTVLGLALEEWPEGLEIWLTVGAAHQAAGEPDEAVAAYERVLELSPEGGWATVARRRIEAIRGGG